MQIDENLVKKLAKLSKLKLTDEEIAKFTPQLADIIAKFDELKEINTSSEIFSLVEANTLREDEVKEGLSREEFLKNVPNSKNGYVKVKSVLGKAT